MRVRRTRPAARHRRICQLRAIVVRDFVITMANALAADIYSVVGVEWCFENQNAVLRSGGVSCCVSSLLRWRRWFLSALRHFRLASWPRTAAVEAGTAGGAGLGAAGGPGGGASAGGGPAGAGGG